MCTMEGVYMFMTEDRLWEFVLSLQHVGPGSECMSSGLMQAAFHDKKSHWPLHQLFKVL